MVVLARFGLYTLVIAALCWLLPHLVEGRDVTHFTENRLIEWIQFALLAAGLAAFLRRAVSAPDQREIMLLIGALITLALFRELDALLEVFVPVLGWKIGPVLVISGVVLLLAARAGRVRAQFDRFAGSTAFVLGWAGFIVAVPLAQLIGHGPFLEALLGDHYHRAYKHLIEESGELIGYFMVLAAGVEAHCAPGPAETRSVHGCTRMR